GRARPRARSPARRARRPGTAGSSRASWRGSLPWSACQPDLDVDAGGEMVEPLQRVDRLRRRLVDVNQPLVRADLEVLARVLVLERRADHAVDVLFSRERDRTGDARAGTRRRLDDLLRGRLDEFRVIRLQTY